MITLTDQRNYLEELTSDLKLEELKNMVLNSEYNSKKEFSVSFGLSKFKNSKNLLPIIEKGYFSIFEIESILKTFFSRVYSIDLKSSSDNKRKRLLAKDSNSGNRINYPLNINKENRKNIIMDIDNNEDLLTDINNYYSIDIIVNGEPNSGINFYYNTLKCSFVEKELAGVTLGPFSCKRITSLTDEQQIFTLKNCITKYISKEQVKSIKNEKNGLDSVFSDKLDPKDFNDFLRNISYNKAKENANTYFEILDKSGVFNKINDGKLFSFKIKERELERSSSILCIILKNLIGKKKYENLFDLRIFKPLFFERPIPIMTQPFIDLIGIKKYYEIPYNSNIGMRTVNIDESKLPKLIKSDVKSDHYTYFCYNGFNVHYRNFR